MLITFCDDIVQSGNVFWKRNIDGDYAIVTDPADIEECRRKIDEMRLKDIKAHSKKPD